MLVVIKLSTGLRYTTDKIYWETSTVVVIGFSKLKR